MTVGVYSILNTTNGKRYIGSSVNLEGRLRYHMSRLLNGKHKNKHLQSAWNKYGKDAFVFTKLLICSVKNVLMYEQRAIDVYKAVGYGYNVTPIAGNTLGCKQSEATKVHASNIRMGIKKSPEAKKAHLEAMRSASVREKISIGRKGISPTKSAEHIQKIAESNRGRKLSDATKEKLREFNLGTKHPHKEATKAKISKAQKGRPLKAAHVEALKLAWQIRKSRIA